MTIIVNHNNIIAADTAMSRTNEVVTRTKLVTPLKPLIDADGNELIVFTGSGIVGDIDKAARQIETGRMTILEFLQFLETMIDSKFARMRMTIYLAYRTPKGAVYTFGNDLQFGIKDPVWAGSGSAVFKNQIRDKLLEDGMKSHELAWLIGSMTSVTGCNNTIQYIDVSAKKPVVKDYNPTKVQQQRLKALYMDVMFKE